MALVEGTPCFTLRYSDLEQAAEVLQRQFSGMSESRSERREDAGSEVAIEVRIAADGSKAARFEQMPGVALRTVDGDLFLVRPGATMMHLNPVAASLWQLLEQPTSLRTAVEVVREAFPHADARQVQRDVRTLFDMLQDAGFIRAAAVGQQASGDRAVAS